MDLADLAQDIFLAVYGFALVMVSIYGLHRYALVLLFYRHRKKSPGPPESFQELPRVTIQLPMYNEPFVARRIIEKTCQIEYPRERLQIQVLDDSIDATCRIAREVVARAREEGFDIEYVHRGERTGYKAGALENGLKTAKGEFITIFDADFLPDPDFLTRSIHYFTDPKVCVVQTRWVHLNRYDNILTRSQAIYLDGHFAIEHVARNRSERFMNFNGTAGTWRRSAIEDSGGWQHDTITEDLDLSYRAQLKGWKFLFLPELTAPAELPPEMAAFKAQQFRWTKGGAQTALKLLPKVLLSKAPLKVRFEAFFHLTSFTVHLYVFMLALMMFPALYLRGLMGQSSNWRITFDISVFGFATLSAAVFYLASELEILRDWRSTLRFLPVLMAVGVGLSVSNTKAIIEALFKKKSEFVRTPKFGLGPGGPGLVGRSPRVRRRRRRSLVPWIELLFGVYMSICAVWSVVNVKSMLAAPFFVMFAFGFFYVSITSCQEVRIAGPAEGATPEAASARASQ